MSAAMDGAGVSATFNFPSGITTDRTSLYVADTNNNKIRKIDIATGEVSSLTGAPDSWVAPGAVDGAGVAATFGNPNGITTDGTSLYVTDSVNDSIRRIQ
jgi:sugar lactone lactonase YvrE